MENKKWFYVQRDVQADYCDFTFRMDLPCLKITRTLVRPEGVFEILAMALFIPKTNVRIPILDSDLPVYFPLSAPDILIIPYFDVDLSNYQSGDIQLGFTISVLKIEGANRLVLWHEIAKVS